MEKTCIECVDSFFPFKISNKCKENTEILHCIEYSEDYTTCVECENYYYYIQTSNQCALIGELFPKCRKVNSTKTMCLECDNGYYLLEGNCK